MPKTFKIQKMKNTQSKIKPIKIKKPKKRNKTKTKNKKQKQKKPRISYCFGCKDFTHNFRLKEIKMTNEELREKSHCVVLQSNKSRFLKQKIN